MLPDFTGQCETFLKLRPPVVSSITKLFAPEFVRRLKEQGIRWFAAAHDAGRGARSACRWHR